MLSEPTRMVKNNTELSIFLHQLPDAGITDMGQDAQLSVYLFFFLTVDLNKLSK